MPSKQNRGYFHREVIDVLERNSKSYKKLNEILIIAISYTRKGEEGMMSNIVFYDDEAGGEIKREKIEPIKASYDLGTLGIWESIISDERKKVKFDKLEKIQVKNVEIPPSSIVIPCSFKRHALGYVETVSSLGRTNRIEEGRQISEVFFRPIQDGIVEKGDLLTVLNILYARPEGEPTPAEKK